MARRIGLRNNQIVAIVAEGSPAKVSGDITLVDVPAQLAGLSDEEIMVSARFRGGQIVVPGRPKPLSEVKAAFVGAWGVPCGISTYAEALFPHMWSQVGDWRLYPEVTPDQKPSDDARVIQGTWARGQNLSRLVEEIENFAPDVVYIQHEYGIFPDARAWLSFISRIRDYRPIVTMHSVFLHKDKTICEAACPEIVVHSTLARDVLINQKGIRSKIHVIPHGCGDYRPNRLYNLYRSKRTFMQFGFGFRYKNWEAPIKAVALLKPKYPDVFFTGLFSEGMFSKLEHQRYYEELMALADSLGVKDSIAFVRGYQSEQVIDSYLGTNQVAVFAYQNDPNHMVYGASGASRRALETGIPVVVSKVPHFCDLEGVCPRADTPEELAAELSKLFDNWKVGQAQAARQLEFLQANSWRAAANKHLEVLGG